MKGKSAKLVAFGLVLLFLFSAMIGMASALLISGGVSETNSQDIKKT